MASIKVENITKIFGDRPKKALEMLEQNITKDEILEKTGSTVGVNKASFEVGEGEIFVIMGLSGSGKSTLIRCMNRLIEPTSGSVWVDDEDVTKMNEEQLRNFRRYKQAMVFQKFALFPHRTVAENVAFGLEIQDISLEERMDKALEALDLVGLKGYANQKPGQLSGGMQQRVGLARCLAVDPEILFMDEAFSALDPLIRRDMQDELLNLQSKMNKTIVFITHDLDEALKLGDRVAIMKDGVIEQIDAPEDILRSPKTEYVARFVEDVDLAKVLTAEGVMVKAKALARPKDGPRMVLRKMREAGISGIFMVNRDDELIGYISSDDARKAVDQDKTDVEDILQREVVTTLPDTTLNDLFELTASASVPVAVVDENKKFKGLIIRGSLLSGLVKEAYPHDD
ncbi:glycine betaine/proline transport system ATP-binding protein [Tindallia magadiensis]|uniref:Quaternary amine transport ATP-binding protein n=1 Tax=Tindallia magadiensis TaxID=69895 RepID=A0A1I3C0R0_9FIRM|nr:glycine betaine/L-proline ABC transporter ATP-binding protein [Tindallia magadiensis]SFH68155.1 glycine betaine/proline transport system ATP-binding protein [Tindallia magadiensis]